MLIPVLVKRRSFAIKKQVFLVHLRVKDLLVSIIAADALFEDEEDSNDETGGQTKNLNVTADLASQGGKQDS